MEVDLDQAIINLLESGITPKDLQQKFTISPSELTSISRLFNAGVKILDYHYDVLPKLHTEELLLLTPSTSTGKLVVASHREAKY